MIPLPSLKQKIISKQVFCKEDYVKEEGDLLVGFPGKPQAKVVDAQKSFRAFRAESMDAADESEGLRIAVRGGGVAGGIEILISVVLNQGGPRGGAAASAVPQISL